MKLSLTRWLPLHRTDDEHVDRVRRNLRFFDRCRWWGFATLLLFEIIFLVFIFAGVDQLAGQFQKGNFGARQVGFWMGFMSGTAVALFQWKIAEVMIRFLAWNRSERLLIRYHDALKSLASESSVVGMPMPANDYSNRAAT